MCPFSDDGSEPVDSGGYRAVAFSYGNPVESTETNNDDIDSGFRPQFPVPENLLKNLVSNSEVLFLSCVFYMVHI